MNLLTKTFVSFAAVSLMSVAAANPTAPGTKEDAKALAIKAADHVKKVGYDQAIKDFSADQASWGIKTRDRVVYVYAYDFNGNVLAHGVNSAAVGKNFLEIKDPDGKAPIADAIKVMRTSASGTIDFKWSNPGTKKIAQGHSYLIRIPGKEAYLAGHVFLE
jgi:cytochrome c